MSIPVPSDADLETLADLEMWQNKLRSLANVTVERRPLTHAGAVPAHSAGFYQSLASQRFRWRATDGSEMGGAIGLTRGAWQQNDPGYGFAPDDRFMIADVHNDQAMAFFRHEEGASPDGAVIVGANAGEEGDAGYLADSIGSYVRRAIEARFADYWFVGGARAAEARAWVDAQPLDPKPRFEVTITSVEAQPLDAATLRALAIAYLPAGIRSRVGSAAGEKSGDPSAIAAAVAKGLEGKPAAAQKMAEKIAKAFPIDAWREALFFDPVDPDLRLVRFVAKRVGTSWIYWGRRAVPQQAVQLLLDAPGAEALARAVDVDRVRFCAKRGPDAARKAVPAAFAKEPDKSPAARTVLGEVEIAALVPAALVPSGVVAGARFTSIAPANDGVMPNGVAYRSV